MLHRLAKTRLVQRLEQRERRGKARVGMVFPLFQPSKVGKEYLEDGVKVEECERKGLGEGNDSLGQLLIREREILELEARELNGEGSLLRQSAPCLGASGPHALLLLPELLLLPRKTLSFANIDRDALKLLVVRGVLNLSARDHQGRR